MLSQGTCVYSTMFGASPGVAQMAGYVWDSLAVVICLGPKFCHWLDSSAPDSSAPASAWTALSEMAFSL